MKFPRPLLLLPLLIAAYACAPKPAKTVPPPPPPPVAEPAPLAPKNPDAGLAVESLRAFGKQKKSHMKYGEYQKRNPGGTGSWLPEWFYDSFRMPMNEKNYWATFTLSTSTRARRSDARIAALLRDSPENIIECELTTPKNETYILLDSEADGVLDFARPKKAVVTAANVLDRRLLEELQPIYTWLIGVLKGYAKNIH